MERTTKRLGIALAVSLGINLFLMGAVATHLLRRPPREPPGRDAGAFLFRATEQLSPDGRTRVRGVMKHHRAELMPRREGMRQARREVQAALESEPFDRARFDRGLERLFGETSKTQLELHRAFGEAAAQLSPEDRKQLAKSMAHFRGPGKPRRR